MIVGKDAWSEILEMVYPEKGEKNCNGRGKKNETVELFREGKEGRKE